MIGDDEMTKIDRIAEQSRKFELDVCKQIDNLSELSNEPRTIIECLVCQFERAIQNYSPTTEFSEELS